LTAAKRETVDTTELDPKAIDFVNLAVCFRLDGGSFGKSAIRENSQIEAVP
jgi:hypothetical protein